MTTEMTLSFNEIMKDAHRIHEFRGDGSYALTSFIREAGTILAFVADNQEATNYIINRAILNKIQGDALHIIRTLGPNPSWENIKEVLINNYGVKESYNQLYKKAFATEKRSVSNVFKYLCNILAKLNEKYEFDREKPEEYKPDRNEAIILKTFLSNINVNFATVIINRNISNLREAYNLLLREDLLVQQENNHNNKTKQQNFQHKDYRQNNNMNNGTDQYNNTQYRSNNTGQYRSNNTGQYRSNNTGQYRSNNIVQNRSNYNEQSRSNNSGQSRINTNNSRQFRYNNERQFNQNNNMQTRQNYSHQNNSNTNTTNNHNGAEPMETDHVNEVNFPLDPTPTIHR